MTKLTFDQLPIVVGTLSDEVSELKNLINSFLQEHATASSDRWMDVPALREYIPGKPATVTIYRMVADRSIPFHRQGKKLYFLKSEVDSWLKEGRNRTRGEIKASV